MPHPKEETGAGYTVSVVTTFPVSQAMAGKVLERWWEFKAKRKQYMRDRRSGRAKS
jgi:hypothetical protein